MRLSVPYTSIYEYIKHLTLRMIIKKCKNLLPSNYELHMSQRIRDGWKRARMKGGGGYVLRLSV